MSNGGNGDDFHLFEDGFRMLYEDGDGMLLDSSGIGQWIEQPPAGGVWTEAGAAAGTWTEQ